MRAWAAALAVAGALACSMPGAPGPGGAAATPRSVALQGGDVSAGLQRCRESGDIPSFLDAARSRSPETFKQIDDEWNRLRAEGVDRGQVEVYTDEAGQCTALLQAAGGTAKVLINFVVSFKDQAAAERAYKNGLLGIRPESTGQQSGVQQGPATGLTQNSLLYNQNLGGQSLYLAIWQNRLFDVFLFAINLPVADARRAASNVNDRIG